ncbi:beta-glucanase [Niveomyces insectorum RCEF 264]|uniref:Beta-glucanase n=1 Tax=Niveomyces insectorum RCEF 264 TaxID=1081102 RepID=A0A162KAD2_9HYPO|nr:beta-glucanase [Niveomyces insectorum RCEF 264]
MHSTAISCAVLLASAPFLARAWNAPGYAGYNLIWQDSFAGASGTPPNAGNWNTITNIAVNDEIEHYTTSTSNLQLSGGNTLQIVPQLESDGTWTSGRIESSYTFTPAAGAVTFAEADIRFGDNPINEKQGLWPAFWLLGDSLRHGTPWPECGEVDVLETVDGRLTGYGTLHCDTYPGGACNEPNGRSGSVAIPDQSWHTWRVQWDRSSNNWQTETMTWFLDGAPFSSISGAELNDEASWSALCHSPLYFILNVAVGGDWPGDPNSSTQGGYGSMMEVAYVAVYAN